MTKKDEIKIIDSILKVLSDERPIFHSELDFQIELAREIGKAPNFQGYKIRLERPVPIIENSPKEGGRQYPDILVFKEKEKLHLFELKYKKQLTKTTNLKDNEKFNLKEDSSQDEGRYDFINDIVRLEKYK